MGVDRSAVIIGAGIMGASIAHQLARRGYDVTVIDKGAAAGAGSTSAPSAVIRFSYSTWDGVALAWESNVHWQHWREHLGMTHEAGLAKVHRVGMLGLDTPDRDRGPVLRPRDNAGIPYELWDAAAIRTHFPALDPAAYFPPKSPSDPDFWADATAAIGGYFSPDSGFVDDPQLAAHNLMA